MATKKEFSIGRLFLQIALGTLLVVGGIWAFTGSGDFGITALKEVCKNLPGNAYNIIKIVYGIIELIVGVFIVIEIFAGDILGMFGKVLKIIVIVIWVASIVLAYLLPWSTSFIFEAKNFLSALYDLALRLIVLGGLFVLL